VFEQRGADAAAAASIADGVRVDLGSALSGLDEHNVTVVAGAVLHAAGHRKLGVPQGTLASGGQGR